MSEQSTRTHAGPRQIECLACGAARVVFGLGRHETGECPQCHYLGWTYSEDLDSSTRRMVMNGLLARPPGRAGAAGRPHRTHLGAGRPLSTSPPPDCRPRLHLVPPLPGESGSGQPR
jgi:hypothetical protein